MIMVRPIVMRRRGHVRVVHRLSMSRDVSSTAVFVVVNHMAVPIWMVMHVPLETVQPDRIHHYPDIVRAQVIILTAYDTDVFISVVDIRIRNDHHGYHWRRRRSRNNNRRRRGSDDDARPGDGWQRHSAGDSHRDE